MDIRISAYSNLATMRFGATATQPAAVAATGSNASASPVEALRAINPVSAGTTQAAAQTQAAQQPNAAQHAEALADGRGKIIDIYA